MRFFVASLGLLAACSFDTGVPNELAAADGAVATDGANTEADGSAADAATIDASTIDAATIDAAAIDAAAIDAAPVDANLPPITYSLEPTGAADVVADFGGAGGGNFDEDCPDGRVLTGFDADNTSNGICRMQAICSLLTANPDGSVVTSDPVLSPMHGSSGSFVEDGPIVCPTNSVVVGASGRVSSAGIVRQLQISCAPLSWAYATTTYSIGTTALVAGDIGTNTGTASAGACAPNQVGAGFGGNAGTLIDRFELHCFALTHVAQ